MLTCSVGLHFTTVFSNLAHFQDNGLKLPDSYQWPCWQWNSGSWSPKTQKCPRLGNTALQLTSNSITHLLLHLFFQIFFWGKKGYLLVLASLILKVFQTSVKLEGHWFLKIIPNNRLPGPNDRIPLEMDLY